MRREEGGEGRADLGGFVCLKGLFGFEVECLESSGDFQHALATVAHFSSPALDLRQAFRYVSAQRESESQSLTRD